MFARETFIEATWIPTIIDGVVYFGRLEVVARAVVPPHRIKFPP